MENKLLKVGVIQLNASADISANFKIIETHIDQASYQSCDLVCLPEVCSYRPSSFFGYKGESINGDIISHFRQLAQSYNVGILVGSFAEAGENGKLYNTSVLIENTGQICCTYRKLHLFDVDKDDLHIHESQVFQSGKQSCAYSFGGWMIGLSICFDVRFPALYDHYRQQGVNLIMIPASFTTKTGQAHWELLIRARAVETQAYVVAPNQYGPGSNGIDTFGNSMIVDPWGDIISRAPDDRDTLIIAELSLARCRDIRSSMPLTDSQWIK